TISCSIKRSRVATAAAYFSGGFPSAPSSGATGPSRQTLRLMVRTPTHPANLETDFIIGILQSDVERYPATDERRFRCWKGKYLCQQRPQKDEHHSSVNGTFFATTLVNGRARACDDYYWRAGLRERPECWVLRCTRGAHAPPLAG